MTKQTPHYHGHRERLRRRVLDKGVESLTDLGVLEYLLFSARPRGDTKPLAKALIKGFGNLAGVLNASREELATVAGLGETSIAALKIVPEAARRLALEEATERPVIASWDKLLAYCRIAMGHQKVEQFRLLFLDKKTMHFVP